jgi:DNA-binding NarL/FixJ family response regulator
MPGLNGVDAIPDLHARCPQTPIVVLSANEDAATVRAAIRAGAAGYVPKTANSHTLLTALRIVLAGDIYIPPRYLENSAHSADKRSAGADCGLTDRQLEVLRLLASGLSNKSVARRLEITEGTVKQHVSAILKVLGVRNRTEAVIAAHDRGLLED